MQIAKAKLQMLIAVFAFYIICVGAYGLRGLSSSNSGLTLELPPLSSQGVSIDISTLNFVTGVFSEYLNISLSNAGDINGDGYDDAIIGVVYENDGAGVTYVIYGSPSMSSSIEIIQNTVPSTKGLSIIGANAYDNSGWSVSAAGDFNGDGIDDVIIGAPGAYFQSGITYVIYGNKTLPDVIHLSNFTAQQGLQIIGDINYYFSGWSVSTAGNFSGDKFIDIIIGAPAANTNGMVYVIYGNTTGASNISLSNLRSEQGFIINGAGGYCGFSVSIAGNFNGDEFDDIIIGAPFANFNAGVSYIIFGGAQLYDISLSNLANQGIYIVGNDEIGKSGYSVSYAGDVNSDGYDDVIIGAPDCNVGSGAAFILFGYNVKFGQSLYISSMTAEQGYTIQGTVSNAQIGLSVSGAGHMTGGAFADVIIGSYIGSSYIIYGSSNGFVPYPSPPAPKVDAFTWPWSPYCARTCRINWSIFYSVISPLVSFLFVYYFREKIAFRILDHWWYKFKLICRGDKVHLYRNEIGLRLDYNGHVQCLFGEKVCNLHADSNCNGISSGLLDILKIVLNDRTKSTFKLKQHEKNQIRDFLIFNSHILTEKICCCLDTYPNLRLVGVIYCLMQLNYGELHKAAAKNQIEAEEDIARERVMSVNTAPVLTVQQLKEMDENVLPSDKDSMYVFRDSDFNMLPQAMEMTKWDINVGERDTFVGERPTLVGSVPIMNPMYK